MRPTRSLLAYFSVKIAFFLQILSRKAHARLYQLYTDMLKKLFSPFRTAEKPASSSAPDYSLELISLHIPKTAGTSFRNTLKSVYGEAEVVRLDIGLVKQELRINEVEYHARILPKGTRVLHGHFNVTDLYLRLELPENIPVITWLRDPIDRVVSNYFYLASRLREELKEESKGINILSKMQRSLSEYARFEPHQNRLTRFLRGTSLENLFYVGFTESYFDDLEILAKKLHWQHYEPHYHNRTPKERPDLDPRDLDLIRSLNQDDIRLYEKAREMKEKGYWNP